MSATEANKNTATTQTEGGSPTPPAEKQVEVQNNQQPEGQQVEKQSPQPEVNEPIFKQLAKIAGGKAVGKTLEELSKLASEEKQADTEKDEGEQSDEGIELPLTEEELETWKALPGGEKVLGLLQWLSKEGLQNLTQQVQRLQEQILTQRYTEELRGLEREIGRNITQVEAQLMYAVATNQLDSGNDISLKEIYNKYIKPLQGASEETKKAVLAQELQKSKQAPQIEGGGATTNPSQPPKTYEEYYRQLVEKGILKGGSQPQPFHRLAEL